MPLLKNGAAVANEWTHAGDEDALPEAGGVTVSLTRLQADGEAFLGRNQPIGVRIQPGDDVLVLENILDRLSLVEVTFPKYTDGRGYSSAQLLRRRLRYAGEVRAIGQVLRDQLAFMVRVGFDAIEFDHSQAEAVFAEAVGEFSHAYQGAADALPNIFEKRCGAPRLNREVV